MLIKPEYLYARTRGAGRQAEKIVRKNVITRRPNAVCMRFMVTLCGGVVSADLRCTLTARRPCAISAVSLAGWQFGFSAGPAVDQRALIGRPECGVRTPTTTQRARGADYAK